MNTLTLLAQATGDEPAGGAAAGEAIGATAGALVVTVAIGLLIAGHRSGRISWLARVAGAAERATAMPVWAALPSMLLGVSLLTAVVGMYWDISLHIDNGRDAGPLANPAHYLILVGLYGTLLAGVMTMALAKTRPGSTSVRVGNGLWLPVGGLLITACGAFALTGFPLDDLWHRLFGQDVTLWGPTHLMLIGGASLATLGGMALTAEAVSSLGRDPEREGPKPLYVLRRALLVGGFLVALSTFQGEFDFGVPQFRMVLHPILIMLAASIGLVAARIYLGRGGALQAVLGFVVIRGFLAVMVGGVWEQTTPHFPLYLVEALIVEAVFLRSKGRSPVATGALAGVLIGTIGLAAEWGWSQIWMPIPWTGSLLPEAAIAGLRDRGGGRRGRRLHRRGGDPPDGRARLRRHPPPRRAHGPRRAPRGTRRPDRGAGRGGLGPADLQQRPAVGPGAPERNRRGEGPREVDASVRIRPADGAEDAHFLNVTAWQGGGSVISELERTGPGLYRSTDPIPVHDGWKALVRLHVGDSLLGVPVYLPEDRAIPAAAVPARPAFTREFVRDLQILQRERKEGVSGWLTAAAYLTVAAIAAALIALIAWALLRLEGLERRPSRWRRSPAAGREPVATS